eukprot:CAMPEP_0117453142 /NCGR_PEP_ID=MMETSP0759-20121206/10052_1 /TAXON_ID=63605 /ORGANISM="Percolomonas cosmopolitus, Strain WS" /LENGTH=147 /DNA_ID=CAMNT_0005246127 /DNA_START=712 /DNA_END=1155 /DNA_ORIENTATION=+
MSHHHFNTPSTNNNLSSPSNTTNPISASSTDTTQRLHSLQSIHSKTLSQQKVELYDALCQSGRKDILKAILKNQLVECGWMQRMQQLCGEELEKTGLDGSRGDEYMDLEAMSRRLREKGMDLVPERIRKDVEKTLTEWIDEEGMRDE